MFRFITVFIKTKRMPGGRTSVQLITNFMGLSPDFLVSAGNNVDQDIEIKKSKETENLSVLTTHLQYQ